MPDNNLTDYLKSSETENVLDLVKAKLKKSPNHLRTIGYAYLNCDDNGVELTRKDRRFRRRDEEGAVQFAALNEADQKRFLEIFFPKIYPYIFAGYHSFIQLAYSGSRLRTKLGLRAPNQPEWHRSNQSYFLRAVIDILLRYNQQDIVWFAEYSGFLRGRTDYTIGHLLAAAIDVNDENSERVLETLIGIGRGDHPHATVSRYMIQALLTASRPEGWEFIESLLLAAQRQEGLRQIILESADRAHPEAFGRMLTLINRENLIRFNSVVRAVDVWFQLGYDVTQSRHAANSLLTFERFFNDQVMAERGVFDEDPHIAYIALIAQGFHDVEVPIARAETLLATGSPDQRFIAAYFLKITHAPPANAILATYLSDEDEHIALLAHNHLRYYRTGVPENFFEVVEENLHRFPQKEKVLPPRIWPWLVLKYDPAETGRMLEFSLGERPISRMLPHLHYFDGYGKSRLLSRWFKTNPAETWDETMRQQVIGWVGDRNSSVRSTAQKAILNQLELTSNEAESLEAYLTRKASDLRKNVLALLLTQADEATVASAERLTSSGKIAQREAGLELVVKLFEGERALDECRQLAADYIEKRPTRNATEEALLKQIPSKDGETIEKYSLEDGLGLIEHANRTPPQLPRDLGFVTTTPIALELIKSLGHCIEQNKDREFQIYQGNNVDTMLLGNIHNNAAWKIGRIDPKKSREENLERFGLRELWFDWWEKNKGIIAKGDGFDLIRAYALTNFAPVYRQKEQKRVNLGNMLPQQWLEEALPRKSLISAILWRILYFFPLPAERDIFTFLLDGIEQTQWYLLHSVEASDFWNNSGPNRGTGLVPGATMWQTTWQQMSRQQPDRLEDKHHLRNWQLKRWFDEPTLIVPQPAPKEKKKPGLIGKLLGLGNLGKLTEQLEDALDNLTLKERFLGGEAEHYSRMPRNRATFEELMEAYVRGGANDDDLMDLLVGPRRNFYRINIPGRRYLYSSSWGFSQLRALSSRKPLPRFEPHASHPAVQATIEKIRERVFEIELQRGDLPTPASTLAKSIRYSGGMERLIALLHRFGKEKFVRGYAFDGESKKAVFSHLIRATFPQEDETPERFAELATAAKISETRLIETAMYAPQWARHIAHTIGWDGLEDGIWWFHAHTKDKSWSVDQQLREAWAAEINSYTPLEAADLTQGAVDVAWFKRSYEQLGPERWTALDKAAKYASSSGGHKRAQLFADAMLGREEQEAVMTRITSKRNQDSVRALGLFPLPENRSEREDELLNRYLFLQEFKRGSRKFGSQRQASEKLAMKIGMENLARTAGYKDPLRLEWAMEKHAVADLAEGPVSVTHDGVTATLEIDRFGDPQVSIERELKNGKRKTLKSVPAKLKKVEEIAELTGRTTDIKRQASRTRLSLENAMMRGDQFSGAELQDLYRHPVLKPMLQQLLFIRESDSAMGYPVMAGTELEGIEQSITRLEPDELLRVAHPHDLLANDWHIWQKECFRQERIQPFKQIFRELYIVTPVEEEAGDVSRRYAGQEVNPKQALALFSQRGWVTHYEMGTSKTFHDENITVYIGTMYGVFTPSDVGGDVIETVFFYKRGERKRMKLVDVPPRLFSEVMRDLDLVVSVAHLGGVDPEASASSVEVRAGLARETADLLKLKNVELKERHILIEGQRNNYSIHLGSGIIHQRPGGYVCVVPVHNSQRGRIFLPFVDKDPKSAEIIAKMVMLANDQKIKDPTILEQLVRK